ncbi:hypothetical protein LEL_01751 [Akanthomyces lecanii RCEF 1005]|uniref:Transcriptional regulator n=1 Tax=Akanthomyces lecanii RCEF 1005 TaxID=1081108 RepID=A0A162KPM9_CORDF|nr:hypothetical protein LEL_01751 [Akanthomyces lecanii RCEF 1005]
MAPSAKALREALIEGTCDVFKLEPDTTSVNKVRHHVEQKLDLEEDFFSGKDWKQKSKEVIKEYVGKLLDGWTPEEKKKTDSKALKKKQTKVEDPEDDATGSSSPERKRKRTAADPSNDDDLDGEDEPNKKAKSESISPDPVVDEEEEYSDVIDEPATSKRKKTKKEPGQKKAPPKAPKAPKPAKSAAAKKTSAAAVAEPSDPLEAEVKKLQGQLGKCGVRKLWHHELKDCDDARAKIRHLKRMLADVGIEGRFSEAKAREIKETRELLADAEAAQEMNRLWGMDSGGRKSRHKSSGRGKTVVESDDSDAENGNDHQEEGVGDGDDDEGKNEVHQGNGKDDEDEDEDVSFAARRRRAHADLAFLGDDSDSD